MRWYGPDSIAFWDEDADYWGLTTQQRVAWLGRISRYYGKRSRSQAAEAERLMRHARPFLIVFVVCEVLMVLSLVVGAVLG